MSALVVLVGERQVERARRAPGERVGAHAQHEPPQRQALAHVDEQHAAVVRQGAEQVALREHRAQRHHRGGIESDCDCNR